MSRDRAPAGSARQRGIGLVTAIFLLVVLALLGAFIVTITSVQQATPALGVQGGRAYHAARSGIEWAIYRALQPATRAATCGAAPSTPASNTFSFSGAGLNGFSVTVVCSYTQHQEGPPPVFQVFSITSTASSGAFGFPDFFSRTIRATVTDAP